ncbi:MAG: NAD(P)-dependent oxidoreductase [Thermoanaerobacteraceae bacterium]|nr:NAD(P)-dependent oxidoreductase [Thermoanaerobacteraceae bacterium]
MSKPRVGWIGLGNMGKPMSSRLLEAGYPLTVYNRTAEKAKELVSKGAKLASSPKEVAEASEFVFITIADSKALIDVCLGKDGVVEGLKPGSIVIDHSTVSPEASLQVNEAVEAKGCKLLRAPVTGSTVLAAAGTLGILCSGDREAYEKTLELFKILGKNQFYLGGGEESRYMKLALNIMVGTTCQMLAEALVFGERAGLNWGQMLEVIAGSAVGSPLVNYKAKPLANRDYTPAFTTRLMEKDFDLALEIARSMDVSLPITALTRQFLAAARATGKGELDFSSLVLLAEEMAGITQ